MNVKTCEDLLRLGKPCDQSKDPWKAPDSPEGGGHGPEIRTEPRDVPSEPREAIAEDAPLLAPKAKAPRRPPPYKSKALPSQDVRPEQREERASERASERVESRRSSESSVDFDVTLLPEVAKEEAEPAGPLVGRWATLHIIQRHPTTILYIQMCQS